MTFGTKKMVRLAMLLSLALIIWTVEMALPVPVAVPGAKLGLANVIILWTVVSMGLTDALLINVLRAFLGSLLTGTFLNVSFFMSMAGGTASTLVMGLLWIWARRWVSLVGVSITGAFFHNLAQVLMAFVLIGHRGILIYLPLLLLIAFPTGLLVGLVVWQLGRLSVLRLAVGESRVSSRTGEEALACEPTGDS